MSRRKIVGSVVSVSGVVFLSKILGFVKQIVMANAFGATIETDIIALAQDLVSNVDYILVQALTTAFVPTYIHLKTDNELKEDIFTSKTFIICILGSFIMVLAMILFSRFLARVIAPSYSDIMSGELSKYICINSPALILIVLIALFNALLKANEVFVPGELVGLNQSLVYIVLIIAVGSIFGVKTLVLTFYFSAVVNLLYLVFCARNTWRFKLNGEIIDQNIKKLLHMMAPLLLGYSMIFLNQEIDAIIVSGLGDGVVTAMSYAAVLSNFVSTFVGSICGVLFTYVTQKIAEKDDYRSAELLNESVIYMVTLILPVSVLFVMNTKDIVLMVFGHGHFGNNAVFNCSYALLGYSFMFVPYVIRELFSRFQYGYGDSKQPMINSVIAIVFNTLFSILLSRKFGVLGVTIATSISVVICSVLNILSSKKKNKNLEFGLYSKYMPLWIAGSLICMFVSIIGKYLFSDSNVIIRLMVVLTISFLCYGIINLSIIKQFYLKIKNR